MQDPFRHDPFPGAGKILFVGDVHGTHARSWIDIVRGAGLNVRGFGGVNGAIPQDMNVPCYSPVNQHPRTPFFRPILTNHWTLSALLRNYDDLRGNLLTRRALRRVIRQWQPDIVHTLGLFSASQSYLAALRRISDPRPVWVVQARGGPDIEVNRHIDDQRAVLQRILAECDYFIADTDQNLAAAVDLGLDPVKLSSIGRVPGTGGIDVEEIAVQVTTPPSRRERLIFIPKAYEHVQSKALPILEALKLCWSKIAPCKIVCTAVNPEVIPWLKTLPEEISQSIEAHPRLPRNRVFQLMVEARVVLAPSIMDGIPNTLFEAMAAGALPIISPLPTITPHVSDPDNVIFARNLYPHEIANALVRAMGDETSLDAIAERNIALVRKLGAKEQFVEPIREFYRETINKARTIG